MNIKGIIRNAGMDTDPSSYSNRGATTSDLNQDILDKIADAININYGAKALNIFVTMVWQMEFLSATAFLTNLYVLEEFAWDISKITLTNSDNKIENEAGAFHLVAFALCGTSNNDDTKRIRKDFRKPSF
jgi:hypothetical protein